MHAGPKWVLLCGLLPLFGFVVAQKEDGKPPLTRADMAAIEGVKAKKLLGALRYLWRSSKEGGHDPRVVELKPYVKPSPKKPPRQVVH